MEPEGIIWVNSPITTFQQSLTHSALVVSYQHSYKQIVEDKMHNIFFSKLCNWITEDYEQCYNPFVESNCGFEQKKADDLVANVRKEDKIIKDRKTFMFINTNRQKKGSLWI